MKRNFTTVLLCVFALLFVSVQSKSQCATNAYVSNGDNCISLSWFPNASVPNPLPATVELNGSVYTFHDGLGDLGFPAVYKKTAGDCLLPSDYVNGDLTINLTSGAVLCHYPGGTLLAIHDINFTGTQQGKQALIQWSTKAANIARFELQKSNAKGEFKTVGTVAVAEATTQASQYSFTDNLTAETFYRLKVVETNNISWYSRVIKVSAGDAAGFSVYPNPSKGSFTLTGVNPAAVQGLAIYDAQGRKLAFKISGTSAQGVTVALRDKTTGVLMISYTSGNKVAINKILVQ